MNKINEANDFIIRLMNANHQETMAMTNNVIEAHEREIAVLRATIAAIRDGINELCEKPWSPNPTYITSALYPSKETISKYLEGQK